MINVIKNILDLLVSKIENWNVHVNKWSNHNEIGCVISFIKNKNRHNIIIYDNKIKLDIINGFQIGSTYLIEIPVEEKQSINLKIEILLNECLNYTKDSFINLVNEDKEEVILDKLLDENETNF